MRHKNTGPHKKTEINDNRIQLVWLGPIGNQLDTIEFCKEFSI